MKKQISQLSSKEKMETLDILYTAAGTVKGRDATKAFLRELLTPSERIMLGRRIWIARLLLEGHSQAEIGEKLQVGPNTIWRVEKWLRDQMPGYRDAIKGMKKEFKKRKTKSTDPFSLAGLKRRYPMHFLFFPTSKK
jgi:uncharacterized protein YerC